MNYFEQIVAVLDMYNIVSGIDSIYGGWVVSLDGDLVNVPHCYPIYSYDLNAVDDGFMLNLLSKDWFNEEEKDLFRFGFDRALKIAKTKGTCNYWQLP